ncbi:MAG: hypothetical protein Q7S04_01575 [Candidatus Moranbacteria bacterium]|nr:hypothetical protein [Candidatus Moranbacteria bacterium]
MPLNLLVVGDPARVNPLVVLLKNSGVNAVPVLSRNTIDILESIRPYQAKKTLVVFGDALEDKPGFLRLLQRVQRETSMVIISGEHQNSPTPYDSRQLVEEIEKATVCKIRYFSYKEGNHLVLAQKSLAAETPAKQNDERKSSERLINGRTVYLEGRSAEMFDMITQSAGMFVPWHVLRQRFESRGTMYGAIARLRQELKKQFPGAEKAVTTHKYEGIAFDPTLLPAEKITAKPS